MNDLGPRGTHNQWTVWNVASLIFVITTAVMAKVGDKYKYNGSGNYNDLRLLLCEAKLEQNKIRAVAGQRCSPDLCYATTSVKIYDP